GGVLSPLLGPPPPPGPPGQLASARRDLGEAPAGPRGTGGGHRRRPAPVARRGGVPPPANAAAQPKPGRRPRPGGSRRGPGPTERTAGPRAVRAGFRGARLFRPGRAEYDGQRPAPAAVAAATPGEGGRGPAPPHQALRLDSPRRHPPGGPGHDPRPPPPPGPAPR